MAKVELVDVDDIHKNSLVSSADSDEYLGIVDDGSLGDDDKSHLVTQSFLDTNDNSTSYSFRDVQAGSVTYKLVMSDDATNSMATNSPPHEYYVISSPGEVFGPPAEKKVKREPVPEKAITAKRRDEKRRATHNEVERRRRDKINSWITKLAALVPDAMADSSSKGCILSKACDHITDLTRKQKRLEKLEVENKKLMLEVLRLKQELVDVRKESAIMRNDLADTCIVASQRAKGQKS
ncbi:upstream stimulatory factor 2-like isoform X1 [Ostrinia nubilalis]|uniref:upstream stimulatory factor 2-like isoform X1 n=1 Tax=Ostrinia nubilalis TaxID=29057 RepID=UPI003082545D